ncbi:MAG: tRNA (N6-threonylcarbamoyladenosine(37)-N6)-methyltransferase TrmO [Candidatus Hodarchaeota archaeon]
MTKYVIYPIGFIRKSENGDYLEILSEYRSAMFRLETISHIFVLWWMHKFDDPNARKTFITIPRVTNSLEPPQEMGIFATRSPMRPSPVGLTLVKILKVSESQVFIDHIDAYDGTPIIDIKPYLPNSDRVEKDIVLPPWFHHLLTSRLSDKRLSKI